MNWHKVTTAGTGLATAGLLVASAGHSFVELNTPAAGILTSAGASGILLPAALSLPLGWLASWTLSRSWRHQRTAEDSGG